MKGIVVAGGAGTRLHPATAVTSKQLLPVYDKPMIYHPLTTLMLAGIREIMIITTPRDQAALRGLLGDGRQWGLSITFAIQARPKGIAEALLIGRGFLNDEPCALVLGDNIFYGEGFGNVLRRNATLTQGAVVFGYWVADPERYGVLDFDAQGKLRAIIEKPSPAPTNWAVTGLYFYDGEACEIAATLTASKRGELEITDLNNVYLRRGRLKVELFGRGFAWLDAGTPESLLDASNFIATVERRQGLKIAAPEEIAWRAGFITADQLREMATAYGPENGYGRYLLRILQERAANLPARAPARE